MVACTYDKYWCLTLHTLHGRYEVEYVRTSCSTQWR